MMENAAKRSMHNFQDGNSRHYRCARRNEMHDVIIEVGRHATKLLEVVILVFYNSHGGDCGISAVG